MKVSRCVISLLYVLFCTVHGMEDTSFQDSLWIDDEIKDNQTIRFNHNIQLLILVKKDVIADWKKSFSLYRKFWCQREKEKRAMNKYAENMEMLTQSKDFKIVFKQAVFFLYKRFNVWDKSVDKRLVTLIEDGIKCAPEAIVRLYLYLKLLAAKRSLDYEKANPAALYERIGKNLIEDFTDIRQIAYCTAKGMVFMCTKENAFVKKHIHVFDALLKDPNAHCNWVML